LRGEVLTAAIRQPDGRLWLLPTTYEAQVGLERKKFNRAGKGADPRMMN
jgi:hypothetical protein